MNATRSLLTSVDLFAGIGGIRLGFEYAFNHSEESRVEMRTAFVCEKDGHARNTYSQNFRTEPSDWGFDICSKEVKKKRPSVRHLSCRFSVSGLF